MKSQTLLNETEIQIQPPLKISPAYLWMLSESNKRKVFKKYHQKLTARKIRLQISICVSPNFDQWIDIPFYVFFVSLSLNVALECVLIFGVLHWYRCKWYFHIDYGFCSSDFVIGIHANHNVWFIILPFSIWSNNYRSVPLPFGSITVRFLQMTRYRMATWISVK